MTRFNAGERVAQMIDGRTRHGRYAMSQTFRDGAVLDGVIFDGSGCVEYVDPETISHCAAPGDRPAAGRGGTRR